jgi:post-segregation antitoxin (ccd killing protein)
MNTIITVRVPSEIKEKLKKYGVRVSDVVRKSLEEEIEKKRLEEAKRAADRLGEFFSKVSEEEIIKSVKEARRLR